MKIIKVFILCLVIFSGLGPAVLSAAEKSTVLDLEIQPRDLLAEAIVIVRNEKFIGLLLPEPIILDKININGVEVISTVSGGQKTGFTLSIF